MALTNYTDLLASVASWLHRDDLTTQIPDFVTLAEVDLNRRLNLTPQETETTLTATTGVRTIALPSGYDSPIALWLTYWAPRVELPFRLPQDLPVITDNSVPRFWTIDGTNVAFDSPADRALTFTLRYNSTLSLVTTSTNSVMTGSPDAYLYGTLLQASIYLVKDARVPLWQAKYEKTLRDIRQQDNANRRLAKLVTDIPTIKTHSNIITGL